MPTIFEALREDHDVQRRLLDLLDKTQGKSEGRVELYPKLRRALSDHAAAEERWFYAHIMTDPMTTDMARHSVAEHKELDDRIEELDDTQMSSSAWLTKFRALRERVEHHLAEEEREVFQLAGKVLDNEQKTGLAADYRKDMDAA